MEERRGRSLSPWRAGVTLWREGAQATLAALPVALKTVIRLSAEQEKPWPPVGAAIRHAAKNAAGRAADRAEAEPAQDFLDVPERLALAQAARVVEFNSVIAALKPRVATLSVAQKHRIPAFLDMTEREGRPQPTLERWMFAPEREQRREGARPGGNSRPPGRRILTTRRHSLELPPSGAAPARAARFVLGGR